MHGGGALEPVDAEHRELQKHRGRDEEIDRAKGLGEGAVTLRHAARNALIPVITVIGLSFGRLLSGAVIIETVFAWPGLGSYAFRTATSLDFPAIMGVGIVVATIYVLANLLVDLAYALIDPRIQVGQ